MKKIGTLLSMLLALITIAQGQNITLEDIFKKGTYRAQGVAGFRSMADGKTYSVINKEKQLVKMDFASGKQKALICNLDALEWDGKKINIDDYAFNANETKLLLHTETEYIYRHSFLSKVFVYDIKSGTLDLLHPEKVMHPAFSPNSTKMAYVQNHNLYVQDLNTKMLDQVTRDGKDNMVRNGNCDWVYEEEFGFTKAYEWNKDGSEIAYYKFDESKVKEFNFAYYNNLYPTDYRYKYPKAGEDNSMVSIHAYNLQSKQSRKMDIGSENDIYIPRIKYNAFDNSLIIYKMNRLQNKLTMFRIPNGQQESELVFNEDNDKYIDITDNIYFLEKQNLFFYTSERNGYNHIWVHDLGNNTDAPITNGSWEVTNIDGVDEKNKVIYYTSTEKSPMDRNVYKISYDGKIKQLLTAEAGTHNATFSTGNKYFLDAYSKLNTAPTYSLKDNNGKLVRMLQDNAELNSTLSQSAISKVEFMQVPNGLGDTLNAWMLKPKNINDGKKHPLLMFQYSGPGSQQVLNNYTRDFWWYQMLAQKGYIIACVDGRGTGGRGEQFKKVTYKELGKLESDDQIAAAKYFGTLPYIDATRIGIWGWSYGGFMSSICILKGADVFKSAIAVAPVTNWRNYDNIYTERYMRRPQENAKGYDDNSPVNMVDQLKGNYLLIHGSADDNVHFQNSMEMVNALIKADKNFDFEVYPDRAHGISGGNTRYHLYKRLTAFVLEKL